MQKQKSLLLALSYIIFNIILFYVFCFPFPFEEFLGIVDIIIAGDGLGVICELLFYIVSAVFFVFSIYLILSYKDNNLEDENSEKNMLLLKKSFFILVALSAAYLLVLFLFSVTGFMDGEAFGFLLMTMHLFVPFLVIFFFLIRFFCITINKRVKNFKNTIVFGVSLLVIIQIIILCLVFVIAKQGSISFQEAGNEMRSYVLFHNEYLDNKKKKAEMEENWKKLQKTRDSEQRISTNLHTIQVGDSISLIQEKMAGVDYVTGHNAKSLQDQIDIYKKKAEEAKKNLKIAKTPEEIFIIENDIDSANDLVKRLSDRLNALFKIEKACGGVLRVVTYTDYSNGNVNSIKFFIINDKVIAINRGNADRDELESAVDGCSPPINKEELFSSSP